MSMVRAHVYVWGKVQGVCFRASTRDNALAFGVTGWVKNCSDGSVEAVFEGKKEIVDKIVNWCKKGPAGAFVQHIEVSWNDYSGEFDGFSVVYL